MDDLIAAAAGREPADIVLKNCRYVDVFTGKIRSGDIALKGDRIAGVGEGYRGREEADLAGKIVIPGLIDGHMHIESTQLTPEELAKAIVPHGTTAIIADPHEIANVCGMDGVNYIVNASRALPLDVMVMLPSCVPATPFEDSGAVLSAETVGQEIGRGDLFGLGEFMNYPGVIGGAEEDVRKLKAAAAAGKIVDGHAPGVTGQALNAYAAAGIATDHECVTAEEIAEKISKGMYVHIREGSATRNARANAPAVTAANMRRCILCPDDRHVCSLRRQGHIDNNLRVLVSAGIDPVWAVTMGSLNVAECYGLSRRGGIAPGWLADLAVVNDLKDFEVVRVYKSGVLVAKDGVPLFDPSPYRSDRVLSTMHVKDLSPARFDLKLKTGRARVIRLLPDNVVTEEVIRDVPLRGGFAEVKGTDLLKLAVVERHHATGNVGLGLIEGYGLRGGAIALTVSHDSHNAIVLGDDSEDMNTAVSELVRLGGGMTLVRRGAVVGSIPLEIAGLMTYAPIGEMEKKLSALVEEAYRMGVSRAVEPFMSLSFLALAVIPDLKITDRGLFDVKKFAFTEIDA